VARRPEDGGEPGRRRASSPELAHGAGQTGAACTCRVRRPSAPSARQGRGPGPASGQTRSRSGRLRRLLRRPLLGRSVRTPVAVATRAHSVARATTTRESQGRELPGAREATARRRGVEPTGRRGEARRARRFVGRRGAVGANFAEQRESQDRETKPRLIVRAPPVLRQEPGRARTRITGKLLEEGRGQRDVHPDRIDARIADVEAYSHAERTRRRAPAGHFIVVTERRRGEAAPLRQRSSSTIVGRGEDLRRAAHRRARRSPQRSCTEVVEGHRRRPSTRSASGFERRRSRYSSRRASRS